MTDDKTTIQNKNKTGGYALSLNGNVLRMDGRGIINEGLLKKYDHDIQQMVATLDGQPWGFLGLISGNGILVPTAKEGFVEAIRWRATHGMIACAVVAEAALIPALVRSQLKEVYELANVEHAFFESEKEAVAWLATLGCSPS